MKRIKCIRCNGMGKRLVRKDGETVVVRCKDCKGKGKVLDAKSRAEVRELERDIARTKKREEREELDAMTAERSKQKKLLGKMTDAQREAKEAIEERSASFGCPGKIVGVRKGPVITLYEFAPSKMTRIKRLATLQEDLALALSADAVMVRRIPGRDVIGIEISNDSGERQNVGFRASLASVVAAKKAGIEVPINLGTDPFGDPVVDDLVKMPHLLIAGSTGTGKSVGLNCIISSIIATCSPDEVQFYMIDPKGVELSHYNGIPHMQEPMVTSAHYAKQTLENLTREMRRRLSILANHSVRDLAELNARRRDAERKPLPRIVLVIDELGDLMMHDKRDFTNRLAEISQMARATGIHVIAATQRPSVDVLSGRVKVNFPARIAFKVTSMGDSKTIIHTKGAEGLLGRGDMLYMSVTRPAPIRIHAPWVPLDDVKELASKIRKIEEARVMAERERIRAAEEARLATERAQRAKEPPKPEALVPVGQRETAELNIAWAPPAKS